MVLTILVSSNTFAYYEHICLLTKTKSLSLQPATCAGSASNKTSEDYKAHFQKKTCCDLNLVVKKIDQSNLHNFNFDTSSNNIFDIISIPSVLFKSLYDYLLKETLGFANTSPPFILEKVYLFIAVFRI